MLGDLQRALTQKVKLSQIAGRFSSSPHRSFAICDLANIPDSFYFSQSVQSTGEERATLRKQTFHFNATTF